MGEWPVARLTQLAVARRRGQSSGLQSCRWTGRHSVVVGSPTVVVVTSGSVVEVVVGEAAGSLDGATAAGAATLAACPVAAGPPAPPLGMPPGCWPFPFHPDHPPLRPPPLLPVLLGEWRCTGRGSGSVPAACADGPRPPGPTWGTTPTSSTPASPTAAASRTPPPCRRSRRSRSDRIGITAVAGGGSSSPPTRRFSAPNSEVISSWLRTSTLTTLVSRPRSWRSVRTTRLGVVATGNPPGADRRNLTRTAGYPQLPPSEN